MKKTAGILVFMLMFSVFAPMLAFASTQWGQVTYRDGKVSGSVYSDTYYANGVQVAVYNNAGQYVTTVQATYGSVVNNTYYYNLDSTVTIGTYSYVNLVTDSVYKTVYNEPAPTPIFVYMPITSNEIVGSDGKVDSTKLEELLKATGTPELKIKGDFVVLPAAALANGKVLKIVSDAGTYTLPISALDLNALAKELGVDLKDLTIRVEIKKVAGEAAKGLETAVKTLGTAVADFVDFNVIAEGKDGKKKAITNFGKTYVSRTITLNGEYAADSVVGVVYDEANKTFTFVPSVFTTKDGKTVAELRRNGNSIYTVLKVEKAAFTDTEKHWAKEDIALMSNKLLVNGTGSKFEPNRNITRAEFAAILVRALGLNDLEGASKFNDVASTAWYADSVNAAVYAGLLKGYADGTFGPTAEITRAEMATMVIRAMEYAGKTMELSTADQLKVLATYVDGKDSKWAQAELAKAVQAGILKGMPGNKLGTKTNATRAEAVTMLKRFLAGVEFLN